MAFNMLFSKFEFLVMPFRLYNAPATFQTMMNGILQDLNFMVVYLNDILIFSDLDKEHQRHVQQVLNQL
jgi:hypothetical protein